MWGREMRAGLVFVLVSLVLGGWFREWRRAHETRFRDLIQDLETRGAASVGAPGVDGPGSAEPGGADSVPQPAKSSRTRIEIPLAPECMDVDRAAAVELERLPGIGPALASRIVADREQNGPFHGPEGLLRVRGIGPRTLERIRPYLTRAAAADSGSPNAK